jgi:hypothetical protein
MTEIGVMVEKIWLKEVPETYLQFQKVSRANFEKFQGSVWKMVYCGLILNKDRVLNAKWTGFVVVWTGRTMGGQDDALAHRCSPAAAKKGEGEVTNPLGTSPGSGR